MPAGSKGGDLNEHEDGHEVSLCTNITHLSQSPSWAPYHNLLVSTVTLSAFLLSTMSQCDNIVGPRCPWVWRQRQASHWGAASEVCTAHHHVSTMHCFSVSRRRADMRCRVGAGTFSQPRSRASRWHSRSTSGAQVLCNSGASRHPSAR